MHSLVPTIMKNSKMNSIMHPHTPHQKMNGKKNLHDNRNLLDGGGGGGVEIEFWSTPNIHNPGTLTLLKQ